MKYSLSRSTLRSRLLRLRGCCAHAFGTFLAISIVFSPWISNSAVGATVSQSEQSEQDWVVIDQTIRGSFAQGPRQNRAETGEAGMLRIDVPIFAAFDANNAAIKASFLPILEQVAITLTQNPEVVLEVVGRNSSSESGADDLALALNRARNIGAFFERHGVAPKRISAIGIKPSAIGEVSKEKPAESGDGEGKFGILLFVQAASEDSTVKAQ